MEAQEEAPEQELFFDKEKPAKAMAQNAEALPKTLRAEKKEISSPATLRKDKKAVTTSSKKEKLESKSSISKESAGERSALAAINLQAQSTAFNTQQPIEEMVPASTLQDIVNEVAESIKVMQHEGRTDTIVTLRHPPLLKGATLTLSTSDPTSGEFKITFANLKIPGAKEFLDSRLADHSLQTGLERKGIVILSLITTTQPESPAFINPKPTDQQQEGRQGGGSQGQQQKEQRQKESKSSR